MVDDPDNFSLVTRATLAFTKDLSFQWYNQMEFIKGSSGIFITLYALLCPVATSDVVQ